MTKQKTLNEGHSYMRRLFIMLLTVFCMTGSAWADFTPTTGTPYTIVSNTANAYLSISNTVSDNVSLQSYVQIVYFQAGSTDGTYKISTAATDGTQVGASGWNPQPTTSGADWTITEVDGGYRLSASTGYLASDAASAGVALWCDKASDHANGIFTISEYTGASTTSTITWNVMYNSSVVATKSIYNAVEDCSYTCTFSLPAVSISGNTTVTAGDEDQTIELTATSLVGLSCSTEANPVWYFIANNDKTAYLKDNGDGNALTWESSKADEDAYKFAVIGDLFNGVKVKSHSGNWLYSSSVLCPEVNSWYKEDITKTYVTSSSSNSTSFTITGAGTTGIENGFGLRAVESWWSKYVYAGNYTSTNLSYSSFWNSSETPVTGAQVLVYEVAPADEGYAITGTITGNGSVVSGAAVTMTGSTYGLTYTATTGSDGTYSLDEVAADTYTMTVVAAGCATYTATKEVTGNATIDASMETTWGIPQFGGTEWTYNTSTSVFDADGQESTATPGRLNSMGPHMILNDVGTVSVNAGGDTSDSGGITVTGSTSNVTAGLYQWAGSIYVGEYAIASVNYSVDLKGTEADGFATVYADGTLTFTNGTSFGMNDGNDQRWYIGEKGVINTSYTSVSNTSDSRNWDIQAVVADQSNEEGATLQTIKKTILTWGADLSSNINSITVYYKNSAGVLTKLDASAISYDATGITITYQGYTVARNITYDFYVDGVKAGTSGAIEAYQGGEYPDIVVPAKMKYSTDYYTLSSKPTGTVSTDETVDITVTQNLPFLVSSSYDLAHWYTITNHTYKYYLNYVEGAENMSLSRTTTTNADADLFCFVGNVVAGFTIYNKAAGSTKVLSSLQDSTHPWDGNTGGKTYVTLQDKDKEGTNQNWNIQKSSDIDGGFYIGMNNIVASNNVRMNNRDGILAFWNSNAGSGSTFLVNPVLTEGIYAITCERGSSYLTTTTDGTAMASSYQSGSYSTEDANKQWAILKSTVSSDTYLYNVGAKKYVQSDRSLGDTPYAITILSSTGTNKLAYPFVISLGGSQVNTNYYATNGLTTWNDQSDQGNMFTFTPVESSSNIAQLTLKADYDYYLNLLNTLISYANASKLFVLTTTAAASLETEIENIRPAGSTDDYTAAQVTAIAALYTTYKSTASYYNLPTEGRYYIKNCNTSDHVGKYLTDYGALVSTSGPSYYSIWDITVNADGTYTFMNEGAAYVHQPRTAHGTNGVCVPGNAYLTHTATSHNYDCYTMGADANAAKMSFTPMGNGTAMMKASTDNYTASIAIYPNYDWTSATEMETQHLDETLQSGITGKDNQYWTLEQFTAADEAALFTNNARTKKVGFVGGPVTMNNIENIPSLVQLDKLLTEGAKSIASQENTTAIATGATNGALFQEMMNYMANESTAESVIGKSGSSIVPTGMDPTYRLKLSTDKKFYIQNLSRPASSARLIYSTANSKKPWITVDSNTDGYATSSAIYTLAETGTNFFIKNEAGGVYINKRSLAKDMLSSTSTDDAAQIQVEEVVPGVYLIYDASTDTESAQKDMKYMTVGGYPNYNQLTYYDNVELSTMWKIYSINEVEADPLQTMGSIDADGNTYTSFTTFSNDINTQVASAKDVVIYYGTNARFNKEGYEQDGKLRVTLKQLPIIDENYYMQGGCGYAILVKKDGEFKVASDIQMSSVNIQSEGHYAGAYVKNVDVLKPISVSITEDNWQDYYVLAYKSTSTKVGTWNGKAIYGTGFGFYQPHKNEKISESAACLPATEFGNVDWSSYSPNYTSAANAQQLIQEIQESGMGWEIEFQDENGNTTGIGEVDAEGKLHMRQGVYDLTGRKLQETQRGINIVDGKKVLVK